MEFLHEPVAVEVYFEQDGHLRLRNFFWEGSIYQVSAMGRSWREGKYYHFLVMTSLGETFELTLDTEKLRWWIERKWKREAKV